MKITITNREMEDFIWMSYRYCIGRHTGAAANHADTIAKVLTANPGILSKERQESMVNDIRCEINNVLNFKSGIQFDGFHQDKDWFTPLMMFSNTQENPKSKKYFIDCRTGEIDCIDTSKVIESWEAFDSDYEDLIPWVKLSNMFDPKCWRTVTTDNNGCIETFTCYPYPTKRCGQYEIVLAKVGDISGWFLNPDKIVKIE
jgi:hypothetical protein